MAPSQHSNLDRWKPLAENVMSDMGLPDDPQRLVVIATALAGAAQAARDELRPLVTRWRGLAAAWESDGDYNVLKQPVGTIAAMNVKKCAGELEAALSDDGAHDE